MDINNIIINANPEQDTFTCKKEHKNVIYVFYKSDPFGAYGDFGVVTIKGFSKKRDEIVFVDERNNWENVEDFKVGTWMQPNGGDILIPFRNDPMSQSLASTHSLTINGMKKKKPFTNKLNDINGLNVSLIKAENFNV